MIAGPSALAMVMLIGSGGSGTWISWIDTVTPAWLGASAVLLMGEVPISRLGNRGVMAMERLMGKLLVAIDVQMYESGVTAFIGTMIIGQSA